jgi:DNA-binding NarL/FixJ family response regulator
VSNLRILVADDHELVRRGLKELLDSQPGWEVVGEASNGREALELAKRLQPAVVVMDLTMPELSGLTATKRILEILPRTEVVLLTMHQSDGTVREVFEAGARAYVLKTDAGTELVSAVEAVAKHKPYFSPQVADTVLAGYLHSDRQALSTSVRLTTREREIVQLLAEGKTNKEVATVLGISVKTAEAHRININRKLGTQSVSELVRYAIRNGMINP